MFNPSTASTTSAMNDENLKDLAKKLRENEDFKKALLTEFREKLPENEDFKKVLLKEFTKKLQEDDDFKKALLKEFTKKLQEDGDFKKALLTEFREKLPEISETPDPKDGKKKAAKSNNLASIDEMPDDSVELLLKALMRGDMDLIKKAADYAGGNRVAFILS